MIISIPTQSGMFSFCLNGALLKLLASVLLALMLACGYCVMQFCTFVLQSTPEQFLRVVILAALVGGCILIARFLHSRRHEVGA